MTKGILIVKVTQMWNQEIDGWTLKSTYLFSNCLPKTIYKSWYKCMSEKATIIMSIIKIIDLN